MRNDKLAAEYATYNRILRPLIGEDIRLGQKYRSPIPRPRPDGSPHFETSASFVVFEGTNYEGNDLTSSLFWKDWGLASQKGSRAFHLLKHLHPNISDAEADAILGETAEAPSGEVRRQTKYKLALTWGELSAAHIDWWAEFGVPADVLNTYRVVAPLSLTAGSREMYSAQRDPLAFAYLDGEQGEEWQFYQPEPKTFWRKGTFIYGWEQLPFAGDVVILASGMKDGLVIHSATGIPFIAPSGEASWKQIAKLAGQLSKRFGQVFTLFDPDPPGVLATKVCQEETGIPGLPFRFVDNKRDIAQLAKDYGLAFINKRINEALK